MLITENTMSDHSKVSKHKFTSISKLKYWGNNINLSKLEKKSGVKSQNLMNGIL